MQNNLYSKSENIGLWVLTISIISIYLIFILYNSSNVYSAPDDITIFYNQFGKFLNGPKDFNSIIAFFFDVTLFPHPKLTARIATVLSYFTLGNVNLRLFQVTGNIVVVSMIALFYYEAKSVLNNKSASALIVASLIFVPIINSFWTISIISLPFLILFLFLGLKYLIDERYLLSLLFLFLTTFSSGQGFLFFPLSTLYVGYLTVLKRKIDWKLVLYFLATVAIFYSFFYFIYWPKSNPDRSVSIGGISSIPNKIYTLISFLGTVFGSIIKEDRIASIVDFVGGFVVLGLYTWLSIRGLIKKNSKSILFSLLGLFFILLGTLASISRLAEMQVGLSILKIPSRYYIHSIFFTAICIILVFLNFKLSKQKAYIIVLFFLGLYGIRIANSFSQYGTNSMKRNNINRVTISNDQKTSYLERKGKKGLHRNLTKAITMGTYKIPSSYFPEVIESGVSLNSDFDQVDKEIFSLSSFATTDKVIFTEYYFYDESSSNQHTLYLKNQKDAYFYKAKQIDLLNREINSLEKKGLLVNNLKSGKVSKYSLFLHADIMEIPKGRYIVFTHIETPTNVYRKKLGKFIIK